jgi:HAD superfamily hydrolase (TIGR01490 family)
LDLLDLQTSTAAMLKDPEGSASGSAPWPEPLRQVGSLVMVWASFSPEPLAEALARAIKGAGGDIKVRTAPFLASGDIPQAMTAGQTLVAAVRLADRPATVSALDWTQRLAQNIADRRSSFARVLVILCPEPPGETVTSWSELRAAAGVDIVDAGFLGPEYCDDVTDAMGRVPYSAAGFDALAEAVAARFNAGAPEPATTRLPTPRQTIARPTSARLRADATCPPAIGPMTPVSAPWRSVLLTGATGFVGAHLLDALLTHSDAVVECHVRAQTPEDAIARVRHSLERHGLWRAEHAARIVGLCGDLAVPRLGLAEPSWRSLAGRIDAIFHNGALVNFVFPYDALKPTNVDATADLLALAATGRTKPLHFISSVGLITRRPRDGISVAEDEDPGDPATLFSGYEQSKWVADRMVAAAIARGLPASIYRLGLVTGHSQSNRFEQDDFLSALIVTALATGTIPDVDVLQPLIPVDVVTAAVVSIALKPAALGHCYHLVHPRPITGRYAAALARLRGYDTRLLPWNAWRHAALQPGRLAGTALETYAKYLRNADTLAIPHLSIDNAMAAAGPVLASCPPQRDLLARMLDGFVAQGRLAAPVSRSDGAVSSARATSDIVTRVVAMDVDRTLIEGQSQSYLVRALFRAGLLPWRMYGRVVWWHLLHRYFNWRPNNPTRLQQIVLKQLAGVPVARLEGVFREVVAAELLPRIRPAALACLRRWQDEGALVFLVSASLEPLIGLLALELRADGVVATRLRDGGAVVSGELDGGMVEGEEKWRRLTAYATVNLGAWRLEAAYGDDDSDVALLARARQIFAVNPRPGLKAVARERGWTILDWTGPVGPQSAPPR